MAQTTIVSYEGIWEHNNTSRIFRVLSNSKINTLWVEGFENGIVTVDPTAGTLFDNFATAIAGCFAEDSNFGAEVLKAYESDETFIGIKFEFNGAIVTVTKENADENAIYTQWKTAQEKAAEEARLKREAWLKTPEGQEHLAKEKAEKERQKIIEAEVLKIDETIEMEFMDEEAKNNWATFEANNTDPYGMGVIKYARRWAKYMQKLIAEGKSVVEVAEQASHDCDIEGITGFMYGCAVNILSQCWKYGEELRKWHNKDYGYEGDGVVNPAVLTVNVD